MTEEPIALCPNGHPMEVVAEGFGMCPPHGATGWVPWSMTEPITAGWMHNPPGFVDEWLGQPKKGPYGPGAWCPTSHLMLATFLKFEATREEAMTFIEREIAARNANPEAITLTPGPTYEEFLQAVGR